MEILAVAAAILCGVVSLSAFRFQRFTLTIARDMGVGPRDLATAQRHMTPVWMRQVEYLGYLLAIVAIVFGSQEWGWIWGIGIIVAMLFGRGLAVRFWPVPSTEQCITIARREANRGLAESRDRNDRSAERSYAELVTRLEQTGAR